MLKLILRIIAALLDLWNDYRSRGIRPHKWERLERAAQAWRFRSGVKRLLKDVDRISQERPTQFAFYEHLMRRWKEILESSVGMLKVATPSEIEASLGPSAAASSGASLHPEWRNEIVTSLARGLVYKGHFKLSDRYCSTLGLDVLRAPNIMTHEV